MNAGSDTTVNGHLVGAVTLAAAVNLGGLGLTDHPVRVGDLTLAGQAVTIWADRPARNLARLMLLDAASRECGDALARDGTGTITVPETWPPPARAAAVQILHTLLDQMAA
ncbi:MAG TPA: hypothetical protein VK659_20555 [Asanoa sp.]|nr:hypothetical protein [Asanoa sp.]